MSRRWPLLLTLLASGAWIRAALTAGPPLDYSHDAAPAINALAHLHVGAFLHAPALMGAVSLILRAPFGPSPAATSSWATGSARSRAWPGCRCCCSCCCAGCRPPGTHRTTAR